MNFSRRGFIKSAAYKLPFRKVAWMKILNRSVQFRACIVVLSLVAAAVSVFSQTTQEPGPFLPPKTEPLIITPGKPTAIRRPMRLFFLMERTYLGGAALERAAK